MMVFAVTLHNIQEGMAVGVTFAAGAMIAVAARELLPESIIENKNLATLGLILGFVLMMILDVALG